MRWAKVYTTLWPFQLRYTIWLILKSVWWICAIDKLLMLYWIWQDYQCYCLYVHWTLTFGGQHCSGQLSCSTLQLSSFLQIKYMLKWKLLKVAFYICTKLIYIKHPSDIQQISVIAPLGGGYNIKTILDLFFSNFN